MMNMGSRHCLFPDEEGKECKNNEISIGLGLGIVGREKKASRGGCLNGNFRGGPLGGVLGQDCLVCRI